MSVGGRIEELPSASEQVHLNLHKAAPYANDTIPRDLYGVPVRCTRLFPYVKRHRDLKTQGQTVLSWAVVFDSLLPAEICGPRRCVAVLNNCK